MFVSFIAIASLVAQVTAHMSLEEPPARNVMWRMGFNELQEHKDDDYLICNESGGKECPPCGDSADAPSPHPHEAGGVFATGTITRNYSMGQTIDIHVNVTRSHGGNLEFKLCPNDNIRRAVSQRCLNKYPLRVIGRNAITAPFDQPQLIALQVELPNGLTCDQCVLQMTNQAEQFKPQHIMFRNCADIAILGNAKTSGAGGRPLNFDGRHPAQREPFPVQRQHTLFNSRRNFG